MVRYELKPDRVDENEGYVRAVFAQLNSERPAGIRYATFRLEDGVSFIHIASIETDDGSNPLTGLDAFRAFVEGIKDRCVEPPATTGLEEVGSYGVFGQ